MYINLVVLDCKIQVVQVQDMNYIDDNLKLIFIENNYKKMIKLGHMLA